MNLLRKGIILILLFLGNMAYCQENSELSKIITKIDSISDANGTRLGKVKILHITNTFDNTVTDEKSLTKVGYFKFDGQFLVIEEKYFNISKLLYFQIKNGIFEFYFQAY